MDARFCEDWHSVDGRFQNRLEMVKILGQLVKAEVRWNAIHAPRLSLRFERTQQDLARIFLVVGTFVRHA